MVHPPRCKNTKISIPNNEMRKNMKKILQNIGHGIIVALVAPGFLQVLFL